MLRRLDQVNKLSDLPKVLKYDLFSYKLLFTKEKIHIPPVFHISNLGIYVFFYTRGISLLLKEISRNYLKMAMTVKPP